MLDLGRLGASTTLVFHPEPQILAQNYPEIDNRRPCQQRDMQSRLRESRLSFSNAERVELCTISASLANIGGGAGGGRQPALSDSLDLSILKGHRFRFPLEIEHRF